MIKSILQKSKDKVYYKLGKHFYKNLYKKASSFFLFPSYCDKIKYRLLKHLWKKNWSVLNCSKKLALIRLYCKRQILQKYFNQLINDFHLYKEKCVDEFRKENIQLNELKTFIDGQKQLNLEYNNHFNIQNEKYAKILNKFERIYIPPTVEDVKNLKKWLCSNNLMQPYIPKCFSSIGKYTYCNPNLLVETSLQSKIGSFCSIGPNVVIGHGEHAMTFLSTSPYFYLDKWGFKNKDTVSYDKYWTFNLKGVDIGNDVWIGTGVFIKNGITIGDGAIVGAGSVVTHDVPPYAIVVGNPAHILRYRFDEKTIQDLLELKWWDLDDEIIKQIPYDNIQSAIEFLKKQRGKG